MLRWALMFLVLAITAAVLGFGYLSGVAAWAAKTLFVAFNVLFLVTLIAGRDDSKHRR